MTTSNIGHLNIPNPVDLISNLTMLTRETNKTLPGKNYDSHLLNTEYLITQSTRSVINFQVAKD